MDYTEQEPLNSSSTDIFQTRKLPYWRKWIIQLEILLYKNWKMARNNPMLSIAGIIIPALLFFAFYVNIGANNSAAQANSAPFSGRIDFAPFTERKYDDLTCFPRDIDSNIISNVSSCIPILYAVDCSSSNFPSSCWNSSKLMMKELAERNNRLLENTAIGFKNSQRMLDYATKNTGSFGVAFIFEIIDFNTSKLTYEIVVNSSMQENVQAAKIQVDQAFINMVIKFKNSSSEDHVNVSFTSEEIDWLPQYWLKAQPTQYYEFQYNPPSLYGHLYVTYYAGGVPFFLGVAIFSSVILSVASKEKHDRVFSLMKVMGLFDSTYWISWIVLILAIGVLCSYASFLIGYFSKEILFQNINFFLFTLIGSVSFCSIASCSLCFSAIFKRARWVNLIIFFSFSITVFAGWLFPYREGYSGKSAFVFVLYDPAIFPSFAFSLISLFPVFHSAKLYSSIYSGTSRIPTNELLYAQRYYDFDRFVQPYLILENCKENCKYVTADVNSVIYLILLTCLNFFLSWYFSQAFSSEDGSTFLFFLNANYWGFNPKKPFAADLDPDDRILQEQNSSARNQSIRLYKISKAFNDISAVKELTLSMERNEIFVLLGHNGAGKSTTVNMISGQTDPTFGEAFIFGRNLRESKSLIQQNIGLCPQDNVLWPDLSPEDHLYMYARLRGLDKKIISAEIPEILQKYNLLDVSKKQVSTFSGGMKRRVAMSLAVIGSPKLIILDEPTTGLDPLLRRQVWDNIRELKRKSLVLLTTHNMEEADALGDNIAIMSGGKLRASGTSLFLKNRFGSGYQIQLVSSLNHVEKIRETIARLLPQAKIVSQDSGNITLSLPRSSLVAFPNFYRWLEEQEFESENNEKALKSWSFSNSTLEEVFLKIANSEKTVNEEIAALGSGIQKTKCVICNERDSEEVVLLTKTGIEVTAPDLVCLYCATGEIRSEDSKNEDELDLNWNLDGNAAQTQKNRTRNADQVNVQLPKEQDVPKYKEEFDIILSQFSAIMYKNFKLILSGRKTLVAQTIFMIVAAIVFWKVGSSLDDSTTDSICPNGTINSNGCEVSIGNDLGNLETRLFDDLQSDYYSASVIDPNRFFQPGHENNYSLFQDLNSSEYFTALKQNFSDILKRDTFSFISDSTCTDRRYYFYDQFHLNYGLRLTAQDIPTIPAITLEMQNAEFSDSTHSFNYKVWYASQKTFDSMGRGALNLPIFLNSSFNERHIRCANAWYGYGSYYNYNFYVQAYQKLLFLKPTNAISNAILRNLTNDRGENDAQISVHLSTLKDLKFARDKVFKESLSIFVLAYSIVFLLAIMFPLSESVYRTVFETEKDLFYFQRLYGVEVWLFWFSQYTFDFCVILFWGIFFLIFNSFFESAFFVNTSKGFMVLSIFLGAHAISCFGIFCSSLFKRANVARYFSLVAVLGSAVFSAFLVDTTLPQATTLVIAIIPTISFGMAFSFATGWNEFKNPSDLALDLSLLMFFGGILFAFVGIVVHTYLYDSMSSLLPKFAKKKAIVDSIERESIDVNADVKNEKEVALSESQRTLKLVGLSKGFRSKNSEKSFYAVKDLFLTVGDSECFGLLGPNGAGKSTTINMLSGYLEPTSGTILVNGNDVFAKKSEIRSKLGVCPQFDVVWPDLTVKDHIYFFAKVKGVVRKSLNGRIHKIAEQLNLDGDCFNKASDTLSGGMRRRLSIAISLVGGPKIWVLDEPTTGLSPDIKRQLWNVISAEKKHGRAIILSTHSMEEAETLCSRIGIVAGGRLKVVGTTNFLKENYGDGYKLSFITLEAVNERKAELLLNNVRNSICASANLGGFIGSSINFILPKHSMDTSSVLRIFELMESRSQKFREENRVMEWGISQTTMEEVFINTVQQKSKAEAVQV